MKKSATSVKTYEYFVVFVVYKDGREGWGNGRIYSTADPLTYEQMKQAEEDLRIRSGAKHLTFTQWPELVATH